jgi:aminoglycoside phosphotransferase (APT) family kinase protein
MTDAGVRTSGPQREAPMTTKEQTLSEGEMHVIGQGAEAEVFERQDGRVLKLLRARRPVERVAYEVAALDAARSAGLQVPQAYEQVVVDGRPGIVMERLRGTDLLSVLGRKPWLVLRAGRLTGEVHARINAARGPTSLPKVKDVAHEMLASLRRREPAVQLEWIGRILARLPDGDALCHGDFHPGQLMVSDGECVAFDWPAAKRGDPLFDYARTRVLLTTGEPPPGTPLLLRSLAKVARRLLVSSYTRSYERHAARPVDRARVRDWEIVNVAVRLFENVPGERPRLLRRLGKEIARRDATSKRRHT